MKEGREREGEIEIEIRVSDKRTSEKKDLW